MERVLLIEFRYTGEGQHFRVRLFFRAGELRHVTGNRRNRPAQHKGRQTQRAFFAMRTYFQDRPHATRATLSAGTCFYQGQRRLKQRDMLDVQLFAKPYTARIGFVYVKSGLLRYRVTQHSVCPYVVDIAQNE